MIHVVSMPTPASNTTLMEWESTTLILVIYSFIEVLQTTVQSDWVVYIGDFNRLMATVAIFPFV